MRLASPAVLCTALLLTGCPGETPSADRFATDAPAAVSDATLGDTAAPGEDASGATDATGGPEDVAGTDAAAAETTVDSAPAPDADVAGADTSSAKGICPSTADLGLYTKAIDNGAYDVAYGLVATGDGGALLVGETGNGSSQTDVWVVRVGPFGNTLWNKSFGQTGEEEGRAGLVLSNGYLVAGLTRAKGAGNADGWLLRLDTDGNLLWDKTFGGDSTDEFAAIAATPDGGIVLAGTNRSLGGGTEDGWLLRASGAGEVLWQFKYGGSQIDELYAVVALPDGSIAAAGASASGASSGTDAWLLLVDDKGKQIGSKLYSHGDYDDARALAALPGGGFVLTGRASDKGNPKLWTLRTDAAGNLLGKDVVGGNQAESGRAVAVWPDGGFAVVGETDSNTADGTWLGEDGWLLRYDAAGNRLWDQRYGDKGNQWLSGVLALADGGVQMVGRRFETDTTFDAWLLRTDAWGHAACTGLGACKSLTAADCDDGLACTVDQCDSIDGCTHEPLPPGSPCGKGGVCTGAPCVGG